MRILILPLLIIYLGSVEGKLFLKSKNPKNNHNSPLFLKKNKRQFCEMMTLRFKEASASVETCNNKIEDIYHEYRLKDNYQFVEFVQKIIDKNHISSIVELEPNVWNWQKFLYLKNISYRGINSSKQLAKYNLDRFSSNQIDFKVIHSLFDEFPEADLFIFHKLVSEMNLEEIQRVSEISKNYKYSIISAVVDPNSLTSANRFFEAGIQHFVDLEKAPFNLQSDFKMYYDSAGKIIKVCLFKHE